MAIIHIDLDDTTVEFLQGVCDIHNKDLPLSEHMTVDRLDDWHANKSFIDPRINTEGLFANLKIKENAKEVLSILSNRHHIKILTAFPTAQSAKEKVEFVQKHFPFIGIEDITLTWNKNLQKGDVLFDDSPVFLENFEGLKVVFDKPYNQHVKADVRVYNWVEFLDAIIVWESKGILKPSKGETSV